MAYDEDLSRGLRELEDILSRLDDKANNAKWLKEHAPADAPERIKAAIKENFPAAKAEPEPEPQPQPQAAPTPEPQLPAAQAPATAAAPAIAPVEIPPLISSPAPEPAPLPEPAPIPAPKPEPLPAPEPAPAPAPAPVQAPEPAPMPKLISPPALPELKDLPVFLQEPKMETRPAAKLEAPREPLPIPAPVPAEPLKDLPAAPAPAPARKPRLSLKINRTAVILFCAALAAAGGGYQLFLNSAGQRYAAAGRLAAQARNAEAISAYSRIINTYPRSLEAAYSHYAMGDIKALQGDAQAAIGHYEDYMVAAPDKDPKLASSRFKVAELHLKEGRLDDAEYLYQNPVVRESDLAGRAGERVKEILAVKARLAEAKKLIKKSPAKAVEEFTAVAAEQPKYAAALQGLDEARQALAAANNRPAPRRTAPPAKPKPQPAPAAAQPKPPAPPAPAPAAPAPAAARNTPQGQGEACAPIWRAEQSGGRLDADQMFTKVKYDCDGLRQKLEVCKEARDAVMALQGVPPEARVTMEQELDPEWTLAKQLAQDEQVRKRYQDRGCAALLKAVPY